MDDNNAIRVTKRNIPGGRVVYELLEEAARNRWRNMTNKATISEQNFERLRKLGLNFRVLTRRELSEEEEIQLEKRIKDRR